MRETVVFVVIMVVLLLLTVKCTPTSVERAFDVAGYTAALAECRAEGKDAGSYQVYGRCATEADKKYGVEP